LTLLSIEMMIAPQGFSTKIKVLAKSQKTVDIRPPARTFSPRLSRRPPTPGISRIPDRGDSAGGFWAEAAGGRAGYHAPPAAGMPASIPRVNDRPGGLPRGRPVKGSEG